MRKIFVLNRTTKGKKKRKNKFIFSELLIQDDYIFFKERENKKFKRNINKNK